MLPLVSASAGDFRLSLKKAPLAPTYDLHVEYDGELLGGVMKRSSLAGTPLVMRAGPLLDLSRAQIDFTCTQNDILRPLPLEDDGDARVYFNEFQESCRMIDEGTLPLKIPTQCLCEDELELSTAIDKLYTSGSYYACDFFCSNGTQRSERSSDDLSFTKERLCRGHNDRYRAFIQGVKGKRPIDEFNNVSFFDCAALRSCCSEEEGIEDEGKAPPQPRKVKLQHREHIPEHMELEQGASLVSHTDFSAQTTLSRIVETDVAVDALLLPASLTTLLIPLPPFRVASTDDSLEGEKVLAMLLSSELSEMLCRAQGERLPLDAYLDLDLHLDEAWAACFAAFPAQIVSHCNEKRIGTGAIDSTGLEMAISEVPKLPPYLPMYFQGAVGGMPLNIKALLPRTRAIMGGNGSMHAGCSTIDTLLNGLMKHPQLPMKSSTAVSAMRSIGVSFLGGLPSFGNPVTASSFAFLAQADKSGARAISPVFQHVASTNSATMRLVDSAQSHIQAAYRASVATASCRSGYSISDQVESAYAPVSDFEKQQVRDAALEASASVSAGASPPTVEAVQTASSDVPERRETAEAKDQAWGVSPVVSQPDPGLEQEPGKAAFQYQASTQEEHTSPDPGIVHSSSVISSAQRPQTDMLGPGLTGISEMMAEYFQEEQREKVRHEGAEGATPLRIERATIRPDMGMVYNGDTQQGKRHESHTLGPVEERSASSIQHTQPSSHTVSPPSTNVVAPHAPQQHGHLEGKELTGLKLLMSHEVQDALSWVVEDLQHAFGISCISQPLEQPLAFILDARTGLCILTQAQCSDHGELKAAIKQLTSIAFKFAVLWLLVIEEEEEEEEEGAHYHSNLVQSLSQFPTRIILRYGAPHTLVKLIYAACHSAAFETQTMLHTTQKKWLHREALNRLNVQGSQILCSVWRMNVAEESNDTVTEDPAGWTAYREAAIATKKKKVHFPPLLPVVTAHAVTLQLFPTINYYVAAELLSRYPIAKLASLSAPLVGQNKSLEPPLSQAILMDFFALLKWSLSDTPSSSVLKHPQQQQKQQQQQQPAAVPLVSPTLATRRVPPRPLEPQPAQQRYQPQPQPAQQRYQPQPQYSQNRARLVQPRGAVQPPRQRQRHQSMSTQSAHQPESLLPMAAYPASHYHYPQAHPQSATFPAPPDMFSGYRYDQTQRLPAAEHIQSRAPPGQDQYHPMDSRAPPGQDQYHPMDSRAPPGQDQYHPMDLGSGRAVGGTIPAAWLEQPSALVQHTRPLHQPQQLLERQDHYLYPAQPNTSGQPPPWPQHRTHQQAHQPPTQPQPTFYAPLQPETAVQPRTTAQVYTGTSMRPYQPSPQKMQLGQSVPHTHLPPQQHRMNAASPNLQAQPQPGPSLTKAQCGTVSPGNKGLIFDKKSASVSPTGQTRLMWKK